MRRETQSKLRAEIARERERFCDEILTDMSVFRRSIALAILERANALDAELKQNAQCYLH
jgi:hypothetical protein